MLRQGIEPCNCAKIYRPHAIQRTIEATFILKNSLFTRNITDVGFHPTYIILSTYPFGLLLVQTAVFYFLLLLTLIGFFFHSPFPNSPIGIW